MVCESVARNAGRRAIIGNEMPLTVDEECRLFCTLPGDLSPQMCQFRCSRWIAEATAGASLDAVLPKPAGFRQVTRINFRGLLDLPPGTPVRIDDVEIVVPAGKPVSWLDIGQHAARVAAEQGDEMIVMSILHRREVREVPPIWDVPGIIADNPVWSGTIRFFGGDPSRLIIPFASDRPQAVDVYRVRSLIDPGPIAIGVGAILVAVAVALLFQFFMTREISSIVQPIENLLEASGRAVSDIVEEVGPGSAVTPLLLFVAAGGIITIGFALAAKQSGLSVGSITPPSLPSPTGSVSIGPPQARVTAGLGGGSSGGTRRRRS